MLNGNWVLRELCFRYFYEVYYCSKEINSLVSLSGKKCVYFGARYGIR